MSIQIEFPQINEGVKNPFRWYNTKSKWNHARSLCKDDCMYKLLTPVNTLLPFQVYGKDLTPPFNIAWVIYDLDDNPVLTVNSSALKIVKLGDYWYFISDGNYISGRDELECGHYYSQITIVDSTTKVVDWFSEIFYVDKKANLFFESDELEAAVQCLPVLQWWNDCGMVGEIYYGSTGFTNLLYLEEGAVVAEVEPKIIQEGYEDGNKTFIPAFKKRVTNYRLDIGLVPPYVIDALGEMILHENVKLVLPHNLGSAMLNNITLDVQHEKDGNGCFALASLTFEMDDITVVTDCCSETADENPCLSDNMIPQILPQSVTCSSAQTTTWTLVNGASCNDGTNTDAIEKLYMNCFVATMIYRITVIVSNYVSGDITVEFNGNQLGIINSNGVYNYYFSGVSGTKLLRIITNAFNGCVTSDIFRLTDAYLLNNGWTYGEDGFCNKNGSLAQLEILAGLTIGKKYRFVIDVVITSGSVTFTAGSISNQITSSGQYTYTIKITNSDLYFKPDTTETQACITSITACEVQ